ncbi:MAG: PKD domain-containing protein, partial [Anaerolineae bacterium]|nr:PKD domain-containing protein [Anaerolineae bacterium]
MTGKRTSILLSLSCLAVLLLLLGLNQVSTMASTGAHTGPKADFAAALEQAQWAGQYDYTTDIAQTRRYGPRLENAGRSDKVNRLQVNGAVDQPADTVYLSLVAPGQGTAALKVVAGVVYEQQPDKSWQPLQAEASAQLSGSNLSPTDILAAAANVQYATAANTLLPADLLPANDQGLTRLAFDVDGAAFAAVLKRQMEAQLKAENRWQPNMMLDLGQMYTSMTGQGELWISAEGFPVRQMMVLTIPDPNGDTLTAQIKTTFSHWRAVPRSLQTRWLSLLPPIEAGLIRLMAVLVVAAGVVACVTYRGLRRVQAALSIAIITSTVGTPLVNIANASQAMSLLSGATPAADVTVPPPDAEAAEALPTFAEMPFHPLRPPLENKVTHIAPIKAGSLIPQAHPAMLTTGVDTDGDTLTDDVEIFRLGTNPTSVDTDGDSISDIDEVQGFSVGGKTWYLNPKNVDSNGDGRPDTIECPQRVNLDDQNNPQGIVVSACQDTDGDGVPDVYDFDDDADRVPDEVDTSPLVGQKAIAADPGLSLFINGPTANRPLEVTLDIRPTKEQQLYLVDNVYSWAKNDTEGQITRVLSNTLADFSYPGSKAANGDIIVSPAMEITIPWDPTAPTRNLPISGTVPSAATDPIGTWLDQGFLNEYGITAQQQTDGTVVLRAPLNSIQDTVGDRIVGWRVALPYQPSGGSWGAHHQMRLTWKVSALTDSCQPPSGANYFEYCAVTNTQHWTSTVTVLQEYYEPFYVTGMSVTEDGGLDAAIVADDSALSDPYERDLWHLGRSLMTAFIEPKTLPDTSRFSLNDIVTRFSDGSGASAAQRWGIPANAFTIWNQQYANTLRGDNAIMETELGNVLRSTYPGAATNDAVSLLFLREESKRVAIMDNSATPYITVNEGSGEVGVNFGSGNNTLETTLLTVASWKPYRYDGIQWVADGLDTYLEGRRAGLTGLMSNAALDSIAGGSVTDYTAAQETVHTFFKIFYAALYNGRVGVASSNGAVINGQPLDDAALQWAGGAEPALTMSELLITGIYNDIVTATIKVIDGQAVTLTGYAPFDQPQFVQEYGQLAIQQRQAPGLFRERKAGTTGAGAGIAYLYTNFWTGTYAKSNTDIGFNVATAGAAIATVGVALSILGVVLQRSGVINAQQANIMDWTARGMSVTGGVVSLAGAVIRLQNFYAAQKGLTLASVAVQNASMATIEAITSVTKTAAVGGLVFDIAVNVGLFLYMVYSQGLTPGSIGFNVALSQAIAGLVVGLVVFALSFGPAALFVAIFFAVFALVDLILFAICKGTHSDPNSFQCIGYLGYLTKLISEAIYKFTVPIDVTKPGRLSVDVTDAKLVNPALGFQVGNAISVTLAITNTISPKPPPWRYSVVGIAGSYQGSVPNQVLKRSNFAYYLTPTKSGVPTNNLGLGGGAWTDVGSDVRAHFQATGQTTLTTAGINQGVSFYLTEHGALPLLNCWGAGGYVCGDDNQPQRYENASYFGDLVKFDVLPATFSQFMTLAGRGNGGVGLGWDARFPASMDADGDGLISAAYGGADPDDLTDDADGDGLTDYWELNNGFNPNVADGDNDHLTDYWEVFYGTNALTADTDADGVLDGDEVFHPASYAGDPNNTAGSWSGGWLTAYEYSGTTPRYTFVTADPLQPDTDFDQDNDGYEAIYQFNPRAPYAIDPLSIKSADVKASPDNDYVVAAGSSFNYNVQVKSNLDPLLVSKGLMEAELPEDTVQQTQAFTITGQQVLTLSGSLYANPANFPQTQSTNATLRAGAVTQDANFTPPASGQLQALTLDSTADANGYRSLLDRSSNGYTAACQQPGTFDFCPDFSGGYANFTAGDQQIWTSGYNMPDLQQMSVSVWVRPSQAFATDRSLLTLDNYHPYDGTYGPGYFDLLNVKVTANGLRVYTDFKSGSICPTSSTTRANSGSDLVWNQWNHIVIRYDGLQATIYTNGVPGTPVSVANLCGPPNHFVLGESQSFRNDAFLGGVRDQVIYSRALSPAEIQRESSTGYRSFEYKFDEAPTSTVFNDTRYSFNMNCNAYLELCPKAGLSSLNNQAVFFDGSGPYGGQNTQLGSQRVAGDYGLGTPTESDVSFTLMGWVNATTWSGARDVIAVQSYHYGTVISSPYNYTIYYPPYTLAYRDVLGGFGARNGKPFMAGYSPGNKTVTGYTASGSPTLTPNKWYHLAWQRDKVNNVVRMFVDGVQVAELPATTFVVPYYGYLNLGGNFPGDWYDNYQGYLDHLVIVNRVMSVAEIQAVMAESPILNLHLDEEAGAAGFSNGGWGNLTVSCSTCPTAGARGHVREAPVFENGQALTIGGPDLASLDGTDYAITLWVEPDFDLTTEQRLFQHNGLELSLSPDNRVTFCDNSTTTYTSGLAVGLKRWTHIAIINTALGNPTIYINGQPDVTASSSVVPGNCSSSSTQVGGSFIGKLDEVAFYSRPLVAAEVADQYDYQARWFDSRIRPTVLVDNDPPQVSVNLASPYLNNAPGQQLLISAPDGGVGFSIMLVDMVNSSGGTIPLGDDPPGSRVASVTPYLASLPGGLPHGPYTLRVQAYDKATFNRKIEQTIFIDAKPPVASLNAPGGIAAVNDVDLSVTLNGSISDADSGLDNGSVVVRLVENGVAVNEYQSATVSGGQWTATLPFGTLPYGSYQVQLMAEDKVGNAFDGILGTVKLNGRLPQGGVLLASTVISSSNTTLHGFAHSLPYPSNPGLYLPFVGLMPLADGSGNLRTPECITCPTTGVSGKIGEAVRFAGAGDTLQVVTNTVTSSESSLLMWLKPDWSSGSKGYAPTLATANGNTLTIADNLQSMTVDNGSSSQTVPLAMTTNTWHHLALVSNGTTWTAYLDGQATGTITQSVTLGLPLTLSANTQGFSGDLDEVLWYDFALDPEEIYDIANPLNLGVDQAKLNLRSLITQQDDFRSLTLDQPGSNFSTWSYTIPDQVEAPYNMDITVSDANGVTANIGPVWTGLIDTIAPRLTLGASFDNANDQVTITCGADDYFMNDASWVCSLGNVPTATAQTAGWYTNTFSQSQTIRLDAGPGTLASQAATLYACDTVGQCSSSVVDKPGNGGLATITGIEEYMLVYQLDVPTNTDYLPSLPAYTVDRSAQVPAFDRVAYYLELDDGANRDWVYVSMDAFTSDPTAIGVPLTHTFEQTTSNLIVLSNVPGVTVGGPFPEGNIEFWSDCYTPPADSGLGGSSAVNDFDDTRGGVPDCYGSMQVHRAAVGETLFAWNDWATAGTDDLGIGNNSGTHPDWTGEANATNWLTRTLYALVRPTVVVTPDNYTVTPGIPLTVAAPGVLGNDDPVIITATLSVSPTRGTVALQPDGSFVYTATQTGANDSFNYIGQDGYVLAQETTVSLNLGATSCFVETNGDSLTDAASADASALRNAIQAANPGDLIKVAGTCAGVNGNQVLMIDKPIAIDGGYSATNWLAPSDPATYKATIDALNAGVVISITTSGVLTAQGLIVTNGYNNSAYPNSYYGAGIRNLGRLTLSEADISQNTVVSYGGAGIYNENWASLTNVLVEANQANSNGGILNFGGTIYIDQSQLVGNTAALGNDQLDGGPTAYMFVTDSVIRDNTNRGAIANYSHLSLDRTAIINNEANFSAAVTNRGVLTMTNSTVSGNRNLSSFPDSPSGVELIADNSISIVKSFLIRNSTIVSNTGPNSASIPGVQYLFRTGEGSNGLFEGTVIANNGSLDCLGRLDYGTVSFSSLITGSIYNVASDSSCDFPVITPDLNPIPNLTSNLAAEQVHVPQSTSPLLDGVPLGQAGCGTDLVIDQRGQPRGSDWGCDIGAVETQYSDFQSITLSVTQGVSTTFGGPVQAIANVVNDGGCLTGLTVERFNTTHPQADSLIAPGVYWVMTPQGTCVDDGTDGFLVDVTLPFTNPDANDLLCRYTGAGQNWDCGASSFSSDRITRTGVAQFASAWAIGNNPPDSVTILMPPPGGTLTLNQATPATVAGTSYDGNGVLTITVTANDVPLTPVAGGGVNSLPWSVVWTPTVRGLYTVTAAMTDQLSNIVTDTITLFIEDEPIGGLTAINDSPTNLNQTTTLTASITAGTAVSYTWAFGDGAVAQGQVVSHTYAAAGVYTATVTATNTLTPQLTTTAVTINNLTDLTLQKTAAPALVAPGYAVTYTLSFSNSGPGIAYNIALTDAVSLNITNTAVISQSDAPLTQQGGSRYVWQIAALPPGQGGVITVTGQVSAVLPAQQIPNTATIATTSPEVSTANNTASASVTGYSAPLLLGFNPRAQDVPLGSGVSLFYSGPMNASTITSRTVVVHSDFQGQITQTYNVINGGISTVLFNPMRPFLPGEQVQVSATTGPQSLIGMQVVTPTVWQFTMAAPQGTGIFISHPISPTFGGGNSTDVALGDVDGDGDLDAVVANDGAAQTVYLNNGQGQFNSLADSTFGGGDSRSLALGDVDGDGD